MIAEEDKHASSQLLTYWRSHRSITKKSPRTSLGWRSANIPKDQILMQVYKFDLKIAEDRGLIFYQPVV